MRVMVTGSRNWSDDEMWWRARKQVDQMAHDKRGAAERGAYDLVVAEARDVTYGPVRVIDDGELAPSTRTVVGN